MGPVRPYTPINGVEGLSLGLCKRVHSAEGLGALAEMRCRDGALNGPVEGQSFPLAEGCGIQCTAGPSSSVGRSFSDHGVLNHGICGHRQQAADMYTKNYPIVASRRTLRPSLAGYEKPLAAIYAFRSKCHDHFSRAKPLHGQIETARFVRALAETLCDSSRSLVAMVYCIFPGSRYSGGRGLWGPFTPRTLTAIRFRPITGGTITCFLAAYQDLETNGTTKASTMIFDEGHKLLDIYTHL